MKKVVRISITIMIIVICTYTYSYALGGNIKGGADTFLSSAKQSDYNASIAPTIVGLLNILLGIGVIVAIIAGLIIAIKTMSDGSFGKAQLKESLTPFLIGCIVLFGAWGIWKAVVTLLQ